MFVYAFVETGINQYSKASPNYFADMLFCFDTKVCAKAVMM